MLSQRLFAIIYKHRLCGINSVWWQYNADKAYGIMIKCSGSTVMLLSFTSRWCNYKADDEVPATQDSSM